MQANGFGPCEFPSRARLAPTDDEHSRPWEQRSRCEGALEYRGASAAPTSFVPAKGASSGPTPKLPLRKPWRSQAQFFAQQKTRAPLNNSLRSLRGLKRADARRVAQGMAVVLFKRRNAADVRFRPRPTGLSGWPARTKHFLDIAPLCLRKCALIAGQPESQRAQGVIQRCPCAPDVARRAPYVFLYVICALRRGLPAVLPSAPGAAPAFRCRQPAARG